MHSAGVCILPCRSGRQLFPFDQDDIGPTQFGQMIEHCCTDDTAANYNYSRMFFHISSLCLTTAEPLGQSCHNV
jgi:hypothetical protein